MNACLDRFSRAIFLPALFLCVPAAFGAAFVGDAWIVIVVTVLGAEGGVPGTAALG